MHPVDGAFDFYDAIRLYTTIIRFDPVYHGHFKCNLGLSESNKLSIRVSGPKLTTEDEPLNQSDTLTQRLTDG